MTLQLPPDVVAFLQQPRQMAVLATLSSTQFPHLTPVWYLFDAADLWIWMRQTRRKVRHLTARNQVGVYIQASDDPHKGVTLQGTAELTHDSLAERCLQIARRYLEPDELLIWHEHMLYSKNILARITPTAFARNGSSWNL